MEGLSLINNDMANNFSCVPLSQNQPPYPQPIILPATANHPRNIENDTLTEPPQFFDTVKEMRARLIASANDVETVNLNCAIDGDKARLRKWKEHNKFIYGTKVVCSFCY